MSVPEKLWGSPAVSGQAVWDNHFGPGVSVTLTSADFVLAPSQGAPGAGLGRERDECHLLRLLSALLAALLSAFTLHFNLFNSSTGLAALLSSWFE